MFCVVVVAGGKGVEATGEAVDGGVEVEVVIVGKDDVEVAVEDGGGDFVKVLGDEGDAYEITLAALIARSERDGVSQSFSINIHVDVWRTALQLGRRAGLGC